MASGRLILSIVEPLLTAAGLVASGGTLTVKNAGTATLSSLYADAALGTPVANPQTSDSAGRFYDQTDTIWADSSLAYDATVLWPDGSTETYANLYLVGAATNTSGFAPINSPTFTGVPQAPTPATNDSSAKIATTAFVAAQAYAPLASPTFTGVPAAPTATTGTNTTQIATTAFVKAQIASTSSTGVYTSGNLTLTSAASGTLSHGLGANPSRVQAFLVCTSATGSYAVGDLVLMDFNHGASTDYGVAVWIVNDSTTLKYQIAANGAILPNSSGVGVFVTSANFAVKIRAWL